MRKNLKFIIAICIIGVFEFLAIQGFSQNKAKLKVLLPDAVYEEMKESGKLKPTVEYVVVNNNASTKQKEKITETLPEMKSAMSAAQCSCVVPLDNTFSVAEFTIGTAPAYRNDDGSTPVKTIPFNFCFYGTNFTSFFINNNGNITFNHGVGSYSAGGFPAGSAANPDTVMVAPFWADVDTRNTTSGLVYYKITSTSVIVKWEHVGYFSSQADKLNTFQLIITNGLDPLLPNGNNVAFCYGTMQWTTGSASGGVNGFGGTNATVGVNKGDHINFAQVGRFGQAGAAYNGTTALGSGVSWLNNQSFYFNSCANTNIPPIVSGINSCDTIRVCGTNDTVILTGLFLSPESGQNTNVSIDLGDLAGNGATILNNNSGNFASTNVMIIASANNGGNHVITYTASDNGSPAQTSVASSSIFIDTSALVNFNSQIFGVPSLCQGAPTTLSINPTSGATHIWYPSGQFTNSVLVTDTGNVWVTETSGGCSKTLLVDVTETPAADFSYVGTPYCQNMANPMPTYGPHGAAGHFTSSSPDLHLDSITGEVDLLLSVPGIYTVTNFIAATAFCPALSVDATIEITAVPFSGFSYTGSPYCNNDPNPVLPTPDPGATAGIFTETTILPIGADGFIDLPSSPPGTYTITNTVDPIGGCPATFSTSTITITPLPSSNFVFVGSPFCTSFANASPVLIGGGVAGTFSCTPTLNIDSTNGVITLPGTASGIYTVTNLVAANAGCPAVSTDFAIEIVAAISPTFNSLGTVCSDASPIALVGNPSGGEFSGPGVTGVDTFSPAGLSTGTYTVTYTTGASTPCPANFTQVVNVSAIFNASFSYLGSPFCKNGTNPTPVFPVFGSTPGVFSSSSANLIVNSSTGVIDLANSQAGTYTVTNFIPASGGCIANTATTVVAIINAPNASFTYSGSPYCDNASNPSPTLASGSSAGVFSATPSGISLNSDGSVNLSASSAGVYSVSNIIPVSSSNTCASVATTTITITHLPNGAFSYLQSPYCLNGGINPSPTLSGGSPAGTFSASAGLLNINSSTGVITLAGNSVGTYTVSNFYAASGGCPAVTATNTVVLTANQQPAFSYSGSPYCQAVTSATVTLTGAAGTFTSFPTGLSIINSATGEVNPSLSQPGVYTVINNLSPTGSCPAVSASATIEISNSPVSTFSYSGSPYCQTGTNAIPTFSSGANAGVFSSTPGLFFVSPSTGIVNVALSNPGTYTVTNTHPASGLCPAVVFSSVITINAPQNASFTYSSLYFCRTGSESATITGVPNGTFSSNPGGLNMNSSSGLIDFSTSTVNTYLVTYTTPGSCPGSNVVSLQIIDAPNSNAGTTQNMDCSATSATLDGSLSSSPPNISYNWTTSDGNIVSDGNTVHPIVNAAGVYQLTVTNTLTNCSTTSTVSVTRTPPPSASFTADPTSGEAPLVVNFIATNVQPSSTWLWVFGDGNGSISSNPTNTYVDPGTYEVTLYAHNNTPCIDSSKRTIIVYDNYTMIIPNVFSPNGDNINDEFKVKSTGVKTFDGVIYDRWGLKIFQWGSPNEVWNGSTLSGQKSADGTYYFIIKSSGYDNVEHVDKGSITLVK